MRWGFFRIYFLSIDFVDVQLKLWMRITSGAGALPRISGSVNPGAGYEFRPMQVLGYCWCWATDPTVGIVSFYHVKV